MYITVFLMVIGLVMGVFISCGLSGWCVMYRYLDLVISKSFVVLSLLIDIGIK